MSLTADTKYRLAVALGSYAAESEVQPLLEGGGIALAVTAGKTLFVDKNRSGTYTEDGTILRPFRTIQKAINQIIVNNDNTLVNSYLIDVIGPGTYSEQLQLNSLSLVNLTIDGHGVVALLPNGPTVCLDSTSNNDNLVSLNLQGLTFANDINLIGASNTSAFLSFSGDFFNCTFDGVLTATNLGILAIYNSISNNNIALENVVAGVFSGGDGQAPGATLTVVTNVLGNTPLNWGGFTLMRYEKTIAGADATVDSGSLLQYREGCRVGYPGGTITAAGTIIAYSSFFLSNIVGAGTLSNRGSSYYALPTITTITEDGQAIKFRVGGAADLANTAFAWKDAHLSSTQTASPTTAVQSAAGTGATSTVSNATDCAGRINITAGTTSTSAGAQAIISFNKVYNTAPIVILTAQNAATGANLVGVYVTSGTSSFTVGFGTAAIALTAYSWNYLVIETQ